jgi:hypothetical protein
VSVRPHLLRKAPASQLPDKLVTFMQPFVLKGLEGVQPSGTYRVETGAWRTDCLSFLMENRAPRWIWKYVHLGTVGILRPDDIDPLDLAVAPLFAISCCI